MAFRLRRDWSKSTIGRANDTRELTRRGGGHGNFGSLTFSISVDLGSQFLKRFCNGHDFGYVRLEVHGDDILILPANSGENGRKFSLSTARSDYRAFFDGGNYPWIASIKPFGATVAETKLTEQGILVTVPEEKDRMPIEPYTRYNPRRTPYIPRIALPLPAKTEVLPPSTGHLYLVMVPPETDEQFHTLLRFLKLEALRE